MEREAPSSMRSSIERSPRSSVIHSHILALLASVGMLVGSANILALEKPLNAQHRESSIHSIDTLRDIIHHELQLTLRSESAQQFQAPLSITHEREEVPPLTDVILEKVAIKIENLCNTPYETLQKECKMIEGAADWAIKYRLSIEQVMQTNPDELDCNDNTACEILSPHGLPMHLISIWPQKAGHRLDHDWHQFAACKLRDNFFLVIDGKSAVLWNGSLKEYVAQHTFGVPMEIIPGLGISEDARMYFDNPLSKGLGQLHHLVPSEEKMTSYYLQNNTLLAAQ
jgi:hypothetical protein